MLEHGDLYGGLVASQPPWVYLFGAGALSIHDSLDALRLACGLVQVVTGLLAGEAVWRLTANRLAAVFALVALWLRAQARERALLLTLAAAAAGTLATTITIIKPGTGLNVLVPSEPLLVTLALAGVVWALRSPLRTRAAVAAAILGVLLLAQSASLLLDPANPRPFHRPASSIAGWKVGHTREEVDRLVAVAERCPPNTRYGGPQLVAFLAHRRVPADQPDVFIVSRAEMYRALFERLQSDGPRCP